MGNDFRIDALVLHRSGIWHEISLLVSEQYLTLIQKGKFNVRLFHKFNFGYFGFFLNQGNSMSDANYYVLVWHLTWNSPNHYFGSFWHFLWGEISCQMPAYYIIAGIWHENSPFKVRACVSAASQFWIFWKWGIYCQIPADRYIWTELGFSYFSISIFSG